jgi:hypothetical protein
MDLKDLELLDVKRFREMFAPHLSLNSCRDIFHIADFPARVVGEAGRRYTTKEACSRWLSTMGRESLMFERERKEESERTAQLSIIKGGGGSYDKTGT